MPEITPVNNTIHDFTEYSVTDSYFKNRQDKDKTNNTSKDQPRIIYDIYDISSGREELPGQKPTNKIDTEFQNEKTEGKLSADEQKTVDELRMRDSEVRAHESAHEAAGGSLVRGKSFSFTVGPDGKQYAIGGEVKIDMSEVPNNPEATILKMQQVRRAALAPADPSGTDRSVASRATAIENEARSKNQTESVNNMSRTKLQMKNISDAYKINEEAQEENEYKVGKLVDLINSSISV